MSWNSFSQTDTTKVKINQPIARLVIKDLLQGDGFKSELKLYYEKVAKLQEREAQKDNIINLLKEKDNNNQYIIQTQSSQLELSMELSKNLEKELKATRRSKFLWQVGTYVGILTSSYILLK